MKIYREREAARALSLSYGYLKALRLKGKINHSRIGRAVLYMESHLEDFINSRQVSIKN